MKKQNLVAGAIILTAASTLTRVLGFVFRVYLSGKIGAEGMGIYQLTFSLYLMFMTLASGGISIAITKLISEHIVSHGEDGVGVIVKKALLWSVFSSVVIGWLMFAGSEFLSVNVLKDARTALSLKFLAPTLPVIAVSSCLNGYFYSMRNVIKPALTQIVEQISKIVIVVAIFILWTPQSIEYACAATVLGLGLGEVICCIFIGAGYRMKKRKNLINPANAPVNVLKRMLGVSVPIVASSTLSSGFRMAENVLIIEKLKQYGDSQSEAVGTYGMLKGMVLPLLLFPSSLLHAFVTTLVPEVARANAGGNDTRITSLISKVLQITAMVSILIVCVFLVFSYELGTLIYKSNTVGTMLAMLSILCPFMYLEMVVVGILSALGQQVHSLKYNIMDSVIRITLIFFLIPIWGIKAFLWVMIVSNLFTSILNIKRLLKVTLVSFNIGDWLIKPTLAAMAAGTAVKLICRYTVGEMFPLWITVIIGVAVMSLLYLLALFLMACIRKKDIIMLADHFRQAKARVS
ncbi:MAG: polysaccharide biosynthesis protein [Oscillospiraceae bacterium]|nr:polysaccharide biosynthesis protein [Oscillospiraceae bacterium]